MDGWQIGKKQYKFTVVYCESMNLIGYITVDYLVMVYGNIVARVILCVILILHGTPRLNLMKHNETVLFYVLLDIFFLLCNETTSQFILKQLDYSPSFSTSDSRLGCASLAICSQKTRARSLIVNQFNTFSYVRD